MQNIIVRDATVDDLKELQRLGTELMQAGLEFDDQGVANWYKTIEGTAYLHKRIKGRNGACFIAEVDGKVVGYATGAILSIESWRPLKRSELDNLCVHQNFRGKGVGTALIEAFIEWSKTRGVERVKVNACADDTKAIAFYKKKGFKPLITTLEAKL